MQKFESMYCLEYSQSQKCFHVWTLGASISCNIECVIEKKESDWLVVGIFGSGDDALAYSDAFEKKLKSFNSKKFSLGEKWAHEKRK